MIYTQDMLLTELGQQLPLGGGENYRLTVKRAVRYVMQRVGLHLTSYIYAEPFQVVEGQIDPLPDFVDRVQDAGFSADCMSGHMLGPSMRSDNPLLFFHTPTGIRFPNLNEGRVYLMIESLPVDEGGNITIIEDIYQACLDYSFAKLLPQFPLHPRFNQYKMLESDALTMIDFTRAQLSKRGRKAQERAERKYAFK